MQRRVRQIAVGVLAAAVVAVTGCGSGMYPVEGKVVWRDGTPATELAGGFVGFSSEAAQVSARGEINPDGTFTLSSLKKDDGLPPGTYKVIVAPPEPNSSEDKNDPGARGRRMLPKKYQSYADSGLEVTVEAKTNQVTITLDKAK